MNEFLIGLQFLTRISIVNQTIWTEESFGKSVKYFPAVGAVLGIFYFAIIVILNILIVSEFNLITIFTNVQFPFLKAAVILISMAILTGAIHCDGFMDTFDGLFSGRERDKMLEIMKDSRVGAFGVVSFVMISIFDFALLSELANLSTLKLLSAIYSAPIIARLMMVVTIAKFKYARPEGMGKAFAKFTNRSTVIFAAILTTILLLPLILLFKELILSIAVSIIAALIFTIYFGNFATKKIGGVTGDIYGAVTTISETIVIMIFLMIN